MNNVDRFEKIEDQGDIVWGSFEVPFLCFGISVVH